MTLLSQKFEIAPRDPTKVDELQSEIDYYTGLVQNGGEYGEPYDVTTELIMQDLLDTPMGGTAEIVREFDDPTARVIGVLHMDAGTLFPTFDHTHPVAQKSPYQMQPILFPRYSTARCYISPRPELLRKGWGMPPPEKIYLALELLARGDKYYANLLLDTPPVGILDLADCDPEWAQGWLESWRGLLTGIDPFKIPVLSGHTAAASFIKFGSNPHELMFDAVVAKYAAIVAAGYGVSLGDTGADTSSGGSSLAGVVRQERRTMRTGSGTVKTKIEGFWNQVLPPSLKFNIVDRDEELMTARGRARLASATALEVLKRAGFISTHEGRDQISADGLMTVPLLGMPDEQVPLLNSPSAPVDPAFPSEQIGEQHVPPSMGGEGEVNLRWYRQALHEARNLIPDSPAVEYVKSVLHGEVIPTTEIADLLVRDAAWMAGIDFEDKAQALRLHAVDMGRDPNEALTALRLSASYAALLTKLLMAHAQTLPMKPSDAQVNTVARQLRADFVALRDN